MSKGINSIGTLLKFALAILGIILCGVIISGADNTAAVSDQIANYGFKLDGAFYLVYFSGALCLAVIVLFAVIHIIQKPKSLIGVAAFAAILLISYYGISGDEVIPDFYPEETTPAISRFVGGGLISLYLIGLAAIVVILYAEIAKLVK